MKRTLIALGLFLFVILPVTLFGRNEFKEDEGTITNSLYADSTSIIDLSDFRDFAFKFKVEILDTSKTDSLTFTLQQSHNKFTWSTIHVYVKNPSDTATIYKYFPIESLLVYPLDRYVRGYITIADGGDTASQEILQPTGNGITLGWLNVNKATPGADTTRWSVLNETTQDTTDYDSVMVKGRWLVVTCANHTKKETAIDSVKIFVRGGYDTDSASFRFGVTLADTAIGFRELSDSTLMKGADTTTYVKNFPHNPYGTDWTQGQLDSLGMIFNSLWVKTGGIAKNNQAYLIIYYAKGTFLPAIHWHNNWMMRD